MSGFSAFDHACMTEALRLAEQGLYTCRPNPRVGCVLARDGRIVGRGWHQRAGQAHAEIRALNEAGDAARGATAYVTLEPCSHHGRTGPCDQALAEAGVAEVVTASVDPNPQVDGRGHERLVEQGIVVRTGLMADAAEDLNRGFYRRMRDGRPWVRVKLAQSLDGRTALANGQSRWISSDASRADVQRWRARSCAIMTGVGTLLADNPSLDVRDIGMERQPDRVIVDSFWRTPPRARTLALPGRVLIAGREDIEIPPGLAESKAELLRLPAASGRVDLAALMAELAHRDMNEVQVEAGATLCGGLVAAALVDELLIYLAPSLLGDASRGTFGFGPLQDMDERIRLEWLDLTRVGPDMRLRARPKRGGD